MDFPAPKFLAGILNILGWFVFWVFRDFFSLFLNSIFKARNAGSDTAGDFAAFFISFLSGRQKHELLLKHQDQDIIIFSPATSGILRAWSGIGVGVG